MRILYLTQFYPPEPGAASVRASEMAEAWTGAGLSVTVLTGFPNYLKGSLFGGYRNAWLGREMRNGVEIARVFTLPSEPGRLFRRLLGQIAFYLISPVAAVRLGPFDLVVASSPPFGLGVVGWLIARLKRAKFVFEVRDLYPESAVALGIIRNRALIGLLRGVERWIYRRADLVVAVTEGIRRYILDRRISDSRIAKITNGVNTDRFDFREAGRAIRSEWGLDGQFIVQYAGLIGMAQGLEAVLEAARLLTNRPDIVVVFVGEGIAKVEVERRAEALGLTNVRFVEGQALERVPEVMSAADVGLALKKKVPLNQGAIPVKMFEYMACRRPVVVGGAAEAEKIVNEADAGLCVDPEKPEDLAAAILLLHRDRKNAERLGENGRAFVTRHYSRRQLGRIYLDRLLALAGDSSKPGGGLAP